MTDHTTAHHVLRGLDEIGIDYVFANLGTDHVSLIEDMADWEEGRRPTVLLVPHENVAMHMAGGYAMATRRGQAVLVHVDAGTANAAMGAHNLFRGRIPVLLLAGKAPFALHGELPGARDNYVHYVQDPFDIASVVRPYVKWEYTLPSGYVAKEALRRAQAVMESDPPGPVYMTLPREVLAETVETPRIRSFGAEGYGPVRAGGVAPEVAAEIATALLAAEKPVAVASYLGRDSEAPPLLEALARETGMRVVEANPTYLNIDRASPAFAGFEAGPVLAGADLGLLLDVDVPFLHGQAPDADAMRWIQVDMDAGKRAFPMWGFRTDLRCEADTATVLRQVLEAVRGRTDEAARARIAGRVAGWDAPNASRRDRIAGAGLSLGGEDAIGPDAVCAALARQLRPEDVVVNEAIRNTGAVLNQLARSLPGTYFANAGGGLGFSGGAALGLKLAGPDRRVVALVGDGTFHFSAPDSVFATAQQYGLPILVVVLDNRGWSAVKQATLRMYPKGRAAETDRFQSRLESGRQDEVRRFDRIAEAFGAHGEYLREPAGLDQAIARCLAAIDGGRAALLHVRVTPL
ncbi:thiamine pyrophosphate-requiring protein [uncultured Enterovirga sp.]|uniref:thiamine pyrophosphate-requiring protein n=1 Tax=uncultured Enterovirga sp. TaxID=2026352 RepID=UPI0035CAE2FB